MMYRPIPNQNHRTTVPPKSPPWRHIVPRFGDVIGGLLNATFGNVVEIILAVAALEKGLYTVVATSLLGR